jgi:hypothetical protein
MTLVFLPGPNTVDIQRRLRRQAEERRAETLPTPAGDTGRQEPPKPEPKPIKKPAKRKGRKK